MSEYKISVIVPCYNSSKTIERTIRSVLSQDFKDFETIFVDDASSDDTVDVILDTLKGENANYQVIVNKENKGPAYTRNRGIHASKGQYIVFLDSDDVINFNHLSSLYKFVKEDNIDSAFVKGVKLDDNDKLFDFEVNRFDSLLSLAKEKKGLIKSSDLIRMELTMEIPFSFVFLIYDKKIISDNELWFNEDYDYGEDTDFALRYLSHCDNVRIIDKYTYFYYQQDDSITHTSSLSRFESIKLFDDLYKYFGDLGFNDLAEILFYNRIPKFIFGNMNYFFKNGFSKDDVFKKMDELGLFDRLDGFKSYTKRDRKFKLKVKLFLANPSLYYKLWMKFKK